MGIKERKLREYEKRRNLILFAAQSLFTQSGLENVTLLDIAKEIEFSKGTIYSHFNSKEEIYAEILLLNLNKLLIQLKKTVVDSSNTIEGIKNGLKTYISFYKKNRDYFKLLFFFDLMSNHYLIPKNLLKEIKSKKLACLIQVQNIIKLDSLKTTPYREISFVLWGMLNGIIHLIESNQVKSIELDKLTDIGFTIVIDGIKNLQKKKQ